MMTGKFNRQRASCITLKLNPPIVKTERHHAQLHKLQIINHRSLFSYPGAAWSLPLRLRSAVDGSLECSLSARSKPRRSFFTNNRISFFAMSRLRAASRDTQATDTSLTLRMQSPTRKPLARALGSTFDTK